MDQDSNGDGRAPIHLFASSKAWIEGAATRQLDLVAALPGVRAVAAMPDLHPGKFGPVGCAILASHLHPQLVGSDIGCGMALFQLDVAARKLRPDRLAERLQALDSPQPEVERLIAEAGLPASAFDAALGSIGGGNHFCEVQVIEDILAPELAARHGLTTDQAYVLVHSGSRGLGASILERVLAQGGAPIEPESESGLAYLAAHEHAVRWAALNRAQIAHRAAAAARAACRLVHDLPHNMLEIVPQAAGGRAVLHRKGAAPADRGLVPVPGSRGTLSYLVEPLADAPREALASVAHGAGRKYDRASMHGRVRAKKSDLADLQRTTYGSVVVCEDRDLLVEEAPAAYKNITHVVEDLEAFRLVRVVATFRPVVTFKKGDAHRPRPRRASSWREERRRR